MNAMIDPELLKKFLDGQTNEEESRRCEEYLADENNQLPFGLNSNFTDENGFVRTLQDTSKQHKTQTHIVDLVEKIQKIVPRKAIGREELTRILSPPESPDEIGRIGEYRVIEFIASGGMGLVFKAEDPELARAVCIKVLHPLLAANPEPKERFERESMAAAKLRSDRIVTVFAVGEHRGLPYLVMQLLSGQSLRELLETEQPSPTETKKIVKQIAEGLRYAHELGYLHRDIKPENIWITSEGDAKILDFGLARVTTETNHLTNTGTILGTPSYMSPEQIQGAEVDERSDLFSLGSVLYEMLLGKCPFTKSNLFSTMMSIANETLPLPEADQSRTIPAQMLPIVTGLLEKDPTDRIANADALIQQLDSIDETSDKPKPKSSDRKAGLIATFCLIACAAFFAFALLVYQNGNKGTLVVKADPSVEVQLKDESVRVKDPKTGDEFLIAIGQKKLNTGVYQLELVDESGKYKLSSNLIVIRRGDKEIVSVELQPTRSDWSDSQQDSSENSIVKSKTNKASRKTANTAEARKILDELPALTPTEITQHFPNIHSAITQASYVQKPPRRKGITSWTIEPKFAYDDCSIDLNVDGTRISTSHRYYGSIVRVWNQQSKLTHLLPAIGPEVYWSPHSDILAILETGMDRVVIWRLQDDGHAEILYVIPGEVEEFSWSPSGLELAMSDDSRTIFFNLQTGKSFSRRKLQTERLWQPPSYSGDGKYLAVAVEPVTQRGEFQNRQVVIWDLEKEEIFYRFKSAYSGNFLPSSNRIAIKKYPKGSGPIEIWNLDTLERENILAATIKDFDPQFTRYIKEGEIRSVSSSQRPRNSANNINLEKLYAIELKIEDQSKSVKELLKAGSPEWSPDGSAILIRRKRKESLIHLNLGIANQNPTASILNLKRNARFPMRLQFSSGSQIVVERSLEQEETLIKEFWLTNLDDLKEQKKLPINSDGDFNAFYAISPNGQHFAIAYANPSDKVESREEQNIRADEEYKTIHIFEFQTGKKVLSKTFEESIKAVRFVNPSCLNINLKKEGERSLGTEFEHPIIFNLDSEKFVELQENEWKIDFLNTSRENSQTQTYDGMLACPVKRRKEIEVDGRKRTVMQNGLGFFDPASGKLAKVFEHDFGTRASFSINGNALMLKDNSVEKFFSIDLSKAEIATMLYESKNSYSNPRPSPMLPFLVWTNNRRYPDLNRLVLFNPKNKSTSEIKKGVESFSGSYFGNENPHVWHDNLPLLSLRSSRRLEIYDVAKKQTVQQLALSADYINAYAYRDGWLVTFDGEIAFVNKNGDIEKRIFSSGQLSNQSTKRFDQYITKTGEYLPATKENLSVLQLRKNRFETISIQQFDSE